MKLTEQLKELQAKATELAEQAALVPGLQQQLADLHAEKESASNIFTEKDVTIAILIEERDALTTEKATLAKAVAALEAEKKATSEQALEIVAGLGLKAPVKVAAQGAEVATAEQVRAKYAELQATSPAEAGRYFAENRETILNGFRS